MAGRVGGIIQLRVNGEILRAKGNFTHNLGEHMREEVMGADGLHGYKETPQPAFIEGEITDDGTLDRRAIVRLTGASINLELANGKEFVLNNAFFAGEGTGNTEEGNMTVRFVGEDGDETT